MATKKVTRKPASKKPKSKTAPPKQPIDKTPSTENGDNEAASITSVHPTFYPEQSEGVHSVATHATLADRVSELTSVLIDGLRAVHEAHFLITNWPYGEPGLENQGGGIDAQVKKAMTSMAMCYSRAFFLYTDDVEKLLISVRPDKEEFGLSPIEVKTEVCTSTSTTYHEAARWLIRFLATTITADLELPEWLYGLMARSPNARYVVPPNGLIDWYLYKRDLLADFPIRRARELETQLDLHGRAAREKALTLDSTSESHGRSETAPKTAPLSFRGGETTRADGIMKMQKRFDDIDMQKSPKSLGKLLDAWRKDGRVKQGQRNGRSVSLSEEDIDDQLTLYINKRLEEQDDNE